MSRRPPAVREWLPRLAPRLSLAIPEPVVRRHAADGYPFAWAIHRRIDDAPYDGVIDTAAAMTAWGRAARRFGSTTICFAQTSWSAMGLTAVIDFGGIGVGDPAADVVAPWASSRTPGARSSRSCLLHEPA
jgi:hypothetical protein